MPTQTDPELEKTIHEQRVTITFAVISAKRSLYSLFCNNCIKLLVLSLLKEDSHVIS